MSDKLKHLLLLLPKKTSRLAPLLPAEDGIKPILVDKPEFLVFGPGLRAVCRRALIGYLAEKLQQKPANLL